MSRSLVFAALLAGCSNAPAPPSTTATVIALGGEAPEGGVTVVSHDAAGSILDQQTADATGTATIGVTDGALITVVFPGQLVATATTLSVITTLAPAAGATITIHGPADPNVAVVAGALTVAPTSSIPAAAYAIELGCNAIATTTLPDTVTVIAPCEGSDTIVDALVLAYDSSTPQQVIGYVAGQADLSSGDAMLTPATWSTTGTEVPVTLTGVAPSLDWAQLVDGLAYAQGPLGATGMLYDGLAVDAAVVHATVGSVVTTLDIAGAPTAINFSTTDFPLPAITPSLALGDLPTLALTWTAPTFTAAASDVQLAWQGPMQNIVWDIVLPTDLTAIAFPQISTEAGSLFTAPSDASMLAANHTIVASTDVPDFGSLAAAGLYVESIFQSVIVPTPSSGEIFTTSAAGFAP